MVIVLAPDPIVSDGIQRKLAAILSADVVAFSRLMEIDEAGTLAALKSHRRDLIDPTIAAFRGRIVGTAGDSILAEYPSAVDAVGCALAVQQGMRERNSGLPESRRMLFRVGVNLGDVIVEGAEIYGDGVNVAARLQSLAEPGGIPLSGDVHRQVDGRLPVAFDDAGHQSVKNLARPIEVWRWRRETPAAMPIGDVTSAPPLPDKPSLAVLPFHNMSGDPAQDHFAVGMTEDIITTLSKIPQLFVIAGTSSFVYRDAAADHRRIGRELGVRFLLEGSIRQAADRVRISAQLVDAATGQHVWAERYDRQMTDIFRLQDEITLRIAIELQVKLTDGEQARLRYTTTSNIEAWSWWMRGLAAYRDIDRESLHHARRMFEQALALDPDAAPILALLSVLHWGDARFGWSTSSELSLQKAEELAQNAIALDPRNSEGHCTLGLCALTRGRHAEALEKCAHAIELNPNHAHNLVFYTLTLTFCGRAAEAVLVAQRAIRLNPMFPPFYLGNLGHALRIAGRYDEAVEAFTGYRRRSPGFGHLDLAIVYHETGRTEAAKTEAAELLRHRPAFSIGEWAKTQFYADRNRLQRDIDALRAAGLPE